MSEVRFVEPVVRICAIITQYESARAWAMEKITKHWGVTAATSEPLPFEAGGFYDAQMGTGLTKVIAEVQAFADPGELASWKLQTNRWEQEYASLGHHDVARPLNLDPGYLSQAKLVLATIKDRDHRLYLRDGIFAEVTLNYVGKKWIHHRWSYPSYRESIVSQFAMASRSRLRNHLIDTGQLRTSKPAN